jgi:hypothetical protein
LYLLLSVAEAVALVSGAGVRLLAGTEHTPPPSAFNVDGPVESEPSALRLPERFFVPERALLGHPCGAFWFSITGKEIAYDPFKVTVKEIGR